MAAGLTGAALVAASLGIGAMPAGADPSDHFADGTMYLTGSLIALGCNQGTFDYEGGSVPCADIQVLDVTGTADHDFLRLYPNADQFPNLDVVEASLLGGDDQVMVAGFEGEYPNLVADMGPGADDLTMTDESSPTIVGAPVPGGYELSGKGTQVATDVESVSVGGIGHPLDVVLVPSTTVSLTFAGSGPPGSTLVLDDRGLDFDIAPSGDSGYRYTLPGFAPIDATSNGGSPDQIGLFDGRVPYLIPAVYEQFLGREPDDGGFVFWNDRLQEGELDGGFTRTDMVTSLLRLPEHATLAVEAEYEAILDRAGEPGGVAFWSDFLQHGAGLDPLRSQLYGSNEYLDAHGGTVDGFLDGVYEDVLHRAPDAGGRAFWTQRADQFGRVRVALEILALAEPVGVRIHDLYVGVLDREPSADEVQFWRTVWPNDGEFRFLAFAAGSGEYLQLVAPVDPADPAYFPEPAQADAALPSGDG